MKKLLILPAILLVIGLTGCVQNTENNVVDTTDADVVVEEMGTEAEALLTEEAAIDAELLDLEETEK